VKNVCEANAKMVITGTLEIFLFCTNYFLKCCEKLLCTDKEMDYGSNVLEILLVQIET